MLARGTRTAPPKRSREARARVAAPPSKPGTRGALPRGPSPTAKAPGSRFALLERLGRTHPLWLSSSGPESLRVSPRRSHLSSGTGATSEWGTWGQRATFAGRWPWQWSGQPRAGRDAELALGGRGGRGGTETAAFQTEAELFQAFKAARARLSLPSLPPSRRPPPCRSCALGRRPARPAPRPLACPEQGRCPTSAPCRTRGWVCVVCVCLCVSPSSLGALAPGSLISPGSEPSPDPHIDPGFSD